MNEQSIDYYHVCPLPLGIGSTIHPGNWGRIIRSYINLNPTPQQLWIMFREQTFELIRATKFPNCPSRFESIFLFDSLDKAKTFKKTNNRMFDLIYKVHLDDPNLPIHTACMKLVDIPNGVKFFGALEENACKYWQANEVHSPEVITLSSVRIIEQIDSSK